MYGAKWRALSSGVATQVVLLMPCCITRPYSTFAHPLPLVQLPLPSPPEGNGFLCQAQHATGYAASGFLSALIDARLGATTGHALPQAMQPTASKAVRCGCSSRAPVAGWQRNRLASEP